MAAVGSSPLGSALCSLHWLTLPLLQSSLRSTAAIPQRWSVLLHFITAQKYRLLRRQVRRLVNPTIPAMAPSESLLSPLSQAAGHPRFLSIRTLCPSSTARLRAPHAHTRPSARRLPTLLVSMPHSSLLLWCVSYPV